MAFWFALFLFVGTTVLSALLQKKPKDASPAAKGEFQFPTAEAGRVIPVIFGTCLLKGANVTWWGDLRVDAIKKKSGGFLGIGAKKVAVGYKYSVGMMLSLCHGPVDALLKIYVGDKDTAAAQTAIGSPETHVAVSIDAPSLFGGDEKEGGVKGDAKFYRGSSTQTGNAYLGSKWGRTASAFRGLCYLVTECVYVGTSQYIKNWSFEARRCPTPAGMNSAHANIGGDANPAHMIVEIMSNASWGLGIPILRFDLASFISAAATLHTESFGMSIMLDSDNSADSILSDILRTIDAALYTDPATGLWTLKLVRADYDPATLQEFTVDDADVPEWSRGSWSETLNEVKVSFTDRSMFYQANVAQFQETANYATQGVIASETMDFRGVSNKTVAMKIAAREAKTHSYPLAQFRLKLNRKAWSLRPGSVFKFSWNPASGDVFTGMALRVTTIRYGALEAGEIEVEAVEDIFSISSTAYSDPEDSSWTDPLGDPLAPVASALFEVPYQFVGEDRWVMATAARGDGLSYSAEVWNDEGLGYVLGSELSDFTPSGLLGSDYSAKTSALDSVGFTIAAGASDLQRLLSASTDSGGLSRGDNLALFDDTGEIVSWRTATENGDGSFTISDVMRGVLDTVPSDHSTGARVWYFTEGSVVTRETSFPSDLTFSSKILPKNPRGVFPIGSATAVSITTTSRSRKPYPPGNVKVNSLSYGSWPSTIVGDAVLTWSHRNRISQGIGGLMVPQDSDAGYLVEGSLNVEVFVGGVLKRTYSNLTGTTLANANIGGPGISYGICGRSDGSVFISSSYLVIGSTAGAAPHCVYQVSSTGVSVYHGSETFYGFTNGGPTESRWHWPQQMAVDSVGNIYVTDQLHVIRRILASNNLAETFVDLTSYYSNPDLGYCTHVCVDSSDNVYVFTGGRQILKITQSRAISVLAGNYWAGDAAVDGTGTSAILSPQCFMACDAAGNLFLKEPYGRIRYVTPAGVVTTIYPHATNWAGGQMAVVGSDLYFSDSLNLGVIHKCTPAGVITDFATHPEQWWPYVIQRDPSAGGHLVYMATPTDGDPYRATSYGRISSSGVFTEIFRRNSPNGYTSAMRVEDDRDGTKAVTMKITPSNGGLTGTVRTTPPILMTGFGMTFGQYFGGVQA